MREEIILALTATTYRPILDGVHLAANRTNGHGATRTAFQQFFVHSYGFDATDTFPGGLDFCKKSLFVLLLLALFPHEPATQFRPRRELFHIEAHAHPNAAALIVKSDRITAKVAHAHPAVSHTAGSEELNSIRQTLARFAHSFEERSFREFTFGSGNHEAAEQHARSRIAVKVFGHLFEFCEAVFVDIHGNP